MQFFSTRDTSRHVTSSEAIVQGLSEEGGLFVPESFPQVDARSICQLDYPAMAAAVLKEYLTDYDPVFLAQAAARTYGEAFGGKAGYLAPVEGDTWSLELWHGPTCAFKDYALQLMPKLLVEAKRNLHHTEKTLILVATSGDTGKAALDGYHDIPGVEIAVFYPTGGTSEIQRLQMATQEGGNVAVYAVRGNFDDAQTGVKRVFADKAIAAQLAERNIHLSSANSINWGRLVSADCLLLCCLCPAGQGREGLFRPGSGFLRSHRQLRRHSGRLLRQADGSAGRPSGLRIQQEQRPDRLPAHRHLYRQTDLL